jgi:CHAT domain-containing protein
MLSALALGDGFLLAHDLERLRLDLDLVTLAGCETGRRRRLGGEEFAGLSRAFLAAGARACLGTLWAVEDGEARDLVFRFYSELAAGETARTALCRAQRSLWNERGPLSSWAAFTLAGAPDIRLAAPASIAMG